LECIDILIEVFGNQRVGIKLSPVGRFQDMYDSDPVPLFTHLLSKLKQRGIAYVQFMEPTPLLNEKYAEKFHPSGNEQIQEVAKTFRHAFSGTIICNNGFTPE